MCSDVCLAIVVRLRSVTLCAALVYTVVHDLFWTAGCRSKGTEETHAWTHMYIYIDYSIYIVYIYKYIHKNGSHKKHRFESFTHYSLEFPIPILGSGLQLGLGGLAICRNV